VLKLYAERIKDRLKDVSHAEQVQKFKLLPRGFTIETDELTPTLKIRRNVVMANFAAEIADMYAS
jgi:long-chain acyl-CoA synthetase